MPLHFADSLLFNCVNFRVIHLWGRYGSGKTALAHYLAIQLMLRFKFRYILSNVMSVIRDDPAEVFLANGKTVDAVLLLDEAGVFMKSASDTEEWLAALRKLNIVILCPSFLPPSRTAKMITTQRVFDGTIIGLPVWWFKVHVDMGVLNEKANFYWRNPSEIYGIYDTEGYPSDADELLNYVHTWLAQAQINTGYASEAETGGDKSKIARLPAQKVARLSPRLASDAPETTRHSTPSYVADVQRAADDLTAAAREAEKTISISRRKTSR